MENVTKCNMSVKFFLRIIYKYHYHTLKIGCKKPRLQKTDYILIKKFISTERERENMPFYLHYFSREPRTNINRRMLAGVKGIKVDL